MTYLKYLSRAGRSTIPVSARVQTRYIDKAKENGWKFNKLVNLALATLTHDYKTDQLPERHADELKCKVPWSIPDGRLKEPTTAVSIRLRADLYNIMAMDQINRNCAINYGLERWFKYLADGRVADYVLTQLQR